MRCGWHADDTLCDVLNPCTYAKCSEECTAKGQKNNRIVEKVRCEDHHNPMECCCTFRCRQLLPQVNGDVGIVAAEEDDNGLTG